MSGLHDSSTGQREGRASHASDNRRRLKSCVQKSRKAYEGSTSEFKLGKIGIQGSSSVRTTRICDTFLYQCTHVYTVDVDRELAK